MQPQSVAELERIILQLPIEARISLLQSLALSLKIPSSPTTKRRPPPELAGRGVELGDIINSIPLSDWNL